MENVSDVRIRQALLYGIDRETILNDLGMGNGEIEVMSVQYTCAPVDPYTDVAWLLSTNGWTKYQNQEVATALAESQALTDQNEITARYLTTDQYVQQDVQMISAYILSALGATSNRLLNATPDVFGSFIDVHEWDITE